MSSKTLQTWINGIGEHLLTSAFRRSRRKRGGAVNRRPSSKFLLEILEDRITPSNWIVTDANGAAGSGSAGDVTLPYAVANAVNGDTITFSLPPASTITLNATLNISANVTVTGPGATSLAISGGGLTQVFNIASGVTASISGVTIEDGQAVSGGGINNSGTLTLSDDAFTDNVCTGFGGAVSNGTFGATDTNLGATLTASNCTFTSNSAGSTAGGLFNFGVLTLSDSTFTSNTAQWGPAVGSAGQCPGYNFNGVGLATLTGCTMTQNTATALNSGGGGVTNLDGTMTLSDCTISNNTVYSGGGVVNNGGTLTLNNDTITNNTATNGGAIATINYFGTPGTTTTTMTNCTVTGNTTTGYGGGIYSTDGTFAVSGCTISGNTGASNGGGIYNTATLTLSSSIVAGNTSMDGADINNATMGTLIAGDANAFTSSTNLHNDGTLNLTGSSNSIGTLTGSGTITNSLNLYQIDNNEITAAFNNTIGTETTSDQAEDCWVGNVFTAADGGTQLQSISFYTGFAGPLNSSTLPDPNISAALYTGAPGAGLTLVPGSENTVPLNADPNEWVTVPFASLQNIPSGQQFTAVLLINDVPSSVYPFDEDTSNDSTNSYFDIDNPIGNVNTYDLAAPNNPTPNGVTYPGQPDGATNAYVDTTIMRVNQTTATLTVTGGGNFSGNIQESGDQQNGGNFLALTVGGTSTTLVLSGDNTYSGLTTIDSGNTLQAGSPTALTASTSVLDNGTLDLNGNDLTINGLNGSASGVVTDSAAAATLSVSGGGSFAGDITGANTALTLLPSTLILSGDNTYGGLTTINSGDTLQAGSITAFSPNSGVLDYGTLDLAGFSNSINALSGNGVVIDSAAAATLSVNGGGTFSGVLQDVSGPLALTVGGTGQTLTLSGANTYSGPTTVSNTDTLIVDGSESSPVTVAGTLGGTGTVGDLTVAGGTVDPSDPVNSTGTLSANSADFSNAGNLSVEINGGSPTNDQLSVAGSVTMGGSSSLTIDLNGLNSTGTFTIVSDGGESGTFTTVNVVNNPNGYSVTVSYTSNTVDVTVAPSSSAPSITGVVINQDISALYNAAGQPFAGAQRSMVNDVVYTFSEAVNIVSSGTDPNVFTIAVAAGWTGTVPTLNWAPVTGSGNTQWAVSFSGGSVSGGSIANGAYDITVNVPSEITAVSDSQALTVTPGTAPGPGNPGYATQEFYRLYGDINGDKFVNAADNSKFKLALATYNQAFDYNGDGFVNAFDNGKFKNELTVNFSGFTATI